MPKKAVNYTVEVQGRKVFVNGMTRAFTGPFVYLFNEQRQVSERIEDQTPEYLRHGRVLASTLDQLLEQLATDDAWGEDAEWVRVSVSELAMLALEDLDGIKGSYVNVICQIEPDTFVGSSDGGRIEVFEIEEFDRLHEAMVSARDRQGGSADVWTVDLTVLETVGRQVKGNDPEDAKMERRACELLRPFGVEVTDTSDGHKACRLDRSVMAPSLYITESKVSPGRFAIEIREVQVEGLDQPSQFIDRLDSRALYEAVEVNVETYDA